MSTFAEKLKQCRQARCMTQDELASILNTTKQVISRYEANLRVPKLDAAVEYAKAVNVPATYLIDPSVSFTVWDHESFVEDYENANVSDKRYLVQQYGLDPRIASDYYNIDTLFVAEKTAAPQGDGLSREFAQLFNQLTPENQKAILAVMRGMTGRDK